MSRRAPPSGVGSAGRPRQRPVRGRVQGPGSGAVGEAVPHPRAVPAKPDSVARLPSTGSARLVLGDGLVRRSAMASRMRFRSTMRPSLDGAGRVLQQLADPMRALGEMVCVTRPCGRVVVADLDQESLVIEVPGVPADLVTGVRAWRRDASYRNGTFARRIPHLLGRRAWWRFRSPPSRWCSPTRGATSAARIGRLRLRAWRSLRLGRQAAVAGWARPRCR
jgi:hypothetical protein